MGLIILLATAAFSLAAVAGFFSVIGLATTYAGSFAAVVALGCTIEFGKLVAVSFLYRFRDKLSIAFKAILVTMVIIVMIITSLGAFGLLTKGNQTDMVGLKQTTVTQSLLQEEEGRLTARKLQIDQQISQLKPEDVTGRVRLNRQFRTEINEINARLPQIAKEKGALATTQITQQADIGPLVYLAKSLGLEIDIATTWFTLLLVAALDPLAVILTICTNIAIVEYQRGRKLAEAAPISSECTASDPVVPADDTVRYNADAQKFERVRDGEWVDWETTPEEYSGPDDIPTEAITLPPNAPVWSSTTYAPVEDSSEPDEQDVSIMPHIANTLTSVDWTTQVSTTEQPSTVLSSVATDLIAQAPVREQSPQLELDFSGDSADELVEMIDDMQHSANEVIVTADKKTPWGTFATIADKVAGNNGPKNQADLEAHLQQLQQYVDELDTRTDKISEDELALRSRILAFISRHQSM